MKKFLIVLVFYLLGSAPVSSLPSEKESWIELTTPSFTLYSGSSRKNTTRIAEDLEQLHAVLGQLTRARTHSPVPTHVYVFKDKARFTPYEPRYQGRPAGAAGYFLSRPHGNIIALNADPSFDPSHIVYHEYIHYVLSNHFKTMPVWINEGLAEYYSSFEVVRDQAKIGRPIARHVHWLRQNSLIPLAQLFAIDRGSPEYNEKSRRGVFYAQSWALVHYLVVGNEERRGQMSRYLELSTRGVGQDEAFAQAFATDYEKLEQELRTYLRRRLMSFITAEVEPLAKSSTEIREMSHPETLVKLGNLLTDMPERGEDAIEHFNLALSKKPDDGQALAGLGYLAMRQGRSDEALAFFRRAAQASRDDFLIQYQFADCLLRGEFPNAKGREETRSALRRSIRSNPKFGPSWALLTRAFTYEAEASDEARLVAESAHKMLPSRRDVANDLLKIYSLRGERDAAQQLFDRVFKAEDKPALLNSARTILLNMDLRTAQELIESDRDEEALEMLEDLRAREPSIGGLSLIDASLQPLRAKMVDNRFTERYNEARRLHDEGDTASAQALLETLVAEADGPRSKQAGEALGQIRESLGHQQIKAEIERVNALLKHGKTEEALRVLKKIEAPEGSAEKLWIDSRVREIRRVLSHNRFADRFNEAARRFNAGDFKTTVRILEELLPTIPEDSRQYRDARKLLADAQAEL